MTALARLTDAALLLYAQAAHDAGRWAEYERVVSALRARALGD